MVDRYRTSQPQLPESAAMPDYKGTPPPWMTPIPHRPLGYQTYPDREPQAPLGSSGRGGYNSGNRGRTQTPSIRLQQPGVFPAAGPARGYPGQQEGDRFDPKAYRPPSTSEGYKPAPLPGYTPGGVVTQPYTADRDYPNYKGSEGLESGNSSYNYGPPSSRFTHPARGETGSWSIGDNRNRSDEMSSAQTKDYNTWTSSYSDTVRSETGLQSSAAGGTRMSGILSTQTRDNNAAPYGYKTPSSSSSEITRSETGSRAFADDSYRPSGIPSAPARNTSAPSHFNSSRSESGSKWQADDSKRLSRIPPAPARNFNPMPHDHNRSAPSNLNQARSETGSKLPSDDSNRFGDMPAASARNFNLMPHDYNTSATSSARSGTGSKWQADDSNRFSGVPSAPARNFNPMQHDYNTSAPSHYNQAKIETGSKLPADDRNKFSGMPSAPTGNFNPMPSDRYKSAPSHYNQAKIDTGSKLPSDDSNRFGDMPPASARNFNPMPHDYNRSAPSHYNPDRSETGSKLPSSDSNRFSRMPPASARNFNPMPHDYNRSAPGHYNPIKSETGSNQQAGISNRFSGMPPVPTRTSNTVSSASMRHSEAQSHHAVGNVNMVTAPSASNSGIGQFVRELREADDNRNVQAPSHVGETHTASAGAKFSVSQDNREVDDMSISSDQSDNEGELVTAPSLVVNYAHGQTQRSDKQDTLYGDTVMPRTTSSSHYGYGNKSSTAFSNSVNKPASSTVTREQSSVTWRDQTRPDHKGEGFSQPKSILKSSAKPWTASQKSKDRTSNTSYVNPMVNKSSSSQRTTVDKSAKSHPNRGVVDLQPTEAARTNKVPSLFDLRIAETNQRKQMLSRVADTKVLPGMSDSSKHARDRQPSAAATASSSAASRSKPAAPREGEDIDDDEPHVQSQIFIGGLSALAIEADIRTMIKNRIACLWIGYHRRTQEVCGFVKMSSLKEAKQVIQEHSKRGTVRLTAAQDFEDYTTMNKPGKRMQSSSGGRERKSFFHGYVEIECPGAPLLGLKYITEYMDDGTVPSIFVCSLCVSQLEGVEVAKHVVGFNHRCRYFKRHHPSISEELCRMQKKVDFLSLTIKCANYAVKYVQSSDAIKVIPTDTPHSFAERQLEELQRRTGVKKHTGAESPVLQLSLDDVTNMKHPPPFTSPPVTAQPAANNVPKLTEIQTKCLVCIPNLPEVFEDVVKHAAVMRGGHLVTEEEGRSWVLIHKVINMRMASMQGKTFLGLRIMLEVQYLDSETAVPGMPSTRAVFKCHLCDETFNTAPNAASHTDGFPHKLKYLLSYYPSHYKVVLTHKSYAAQKREMRSQVETLSRLQEERGHSLRVVLVRSQSQPGMNQGHRFEATKVTAHTNEVELVSQLRDVQQKLVQHKKLTLEKMQIPGPGGVSPFSIPQLGSAGPFRPEQSARPQHASSMSGLAQPYPKKEPVIPSPPLNDLFTDNEPVVGLRYVTEILGKDGTVPALYDCNLCHMIKTDSHRMYSHLTGTVHKIKFLEANYPMLSKQSIGRPEMLSILCRELEVKHGRDRFCVMRLLTQDLKSGKPVYSLVTPAKSCTDDSDPTQEKDDADNKSDGQKLCCFEDIISGLDYTPLLGLRYITEIMQAGEAWAFNSPTYRCSLCPAASRLNTDNILKHICSMGHRTNFIQRNYSTLYQELNSYRNDPPRFLGLLNTYSKEIELMEGRGTIAKIITVKPEEDKMLGTEQVDRGSRVGDDAGMEEEWRQEPVERDRETGQHAGDRHPMTVTPPSSVQVYVGNLPQDCTEVELQELLRRDKGCHIKVSRNNIRYGLVDCETYSEARELMRRLNKVVFKGRSLRLRIDQYLHKQQAGNESTVSNTGVTQVTEGTVEAPSGGVSGQAPCTAADREADDMNKALKLFAELENKEAEALKEVEWKHEIAMLEEKTKSGQVVICTALRPSKLMKIHTVFLRRNAVLGLMWLTEMQKSDDNREPWYLCYLCHHCILWTDIRSHLASIQHALNYLKRRYKVKYDKLQRLVMNNSEEVEQEALKLSREVRRIEGCPSKITVKVEMVSPDLNPEETPGEMSGVPPENRATGYGPTIIQPELSGGLVHTLEDIVREKEAASRTWTLIDEDIRKKIETEELIKTARRPICSHFFSKVLSEKDCMVVGMTWLTEIQHNPRSISPSYLCRLCREKFEKPNLPSHLLSLRHRLLYMRKCYPQVYGELDVGWKSRVRLADRVELWAQEVFHNEPLDADGVEVFLERETTKGRERDAPRGKQDERISERNKDSFSFRNRASGRGNNLDRSRSNERVTDRDKDKGAQWGTGGATDKGLHRGLSKGSERVTDSGNLSRGSKGEDQPRQGKGQGDSRSSKASDNKRPAHRDGADRRDSQLSRSAERKQSSHDQGNRLARSTDGQRMKIAARDAGVRDIPEHKHPAADPSLGPCEEETNPIEDVLTESDIYALEQQLYEQQDVLDQHQPRTETHKRKRRRSSQQEHKSNTHGVTDTWKSESSICAVNLTVVPVLPMESDSGVENIKKRKIQFVKNTVVENVPGNVTEVQNVKDPVEGHVKRKKKRNRGKKTGQQGPKLVETSANTDQSKSKQMPGDISLGDVAVTIEMEGDTAETPIVISADKKVTDVGKQGSKQPVNQLTQVKKNIVEINVQGKPNEDKGEKKSVDKEQSSNKKKPAVIKLEDVAVSIEIEGESTDATGAVKITPVSQLQEKEFTKKTDDGKPKDSREEKDQHKKLSEKEQSTNKKKPVVSSLGDVAVTIEVEGDATDSSSGEKILTDGRKQGGKLQERQLSNMSVVLTRIDSGSEHVNKKKKQFVKNGGEEHIDGKQKEVKEESGQSKKFADKDQSTSKKKPAATGLDNVEVNIEVEERVASSGKEIPTDILKQARDSQENQLTKNIADENVQRTPVEIRGDKSQPKTTADKEESSKKKPVASLDNVNVTVEIQEDSNDSTNTTSTEKIETDVCKQVGKLQQHQLAQMTKVSVLLTRIDSVSEHNDKNRKQVVKNTGQENVQGKVKELKEEVQAKESADKEHSTNKKKSAPSSEVDVAINVEVKEDTTGTHISTGSVNTGTGVSKQVGQLQGKRLPKITVDGNVERKPEEVREEKGQPKKPLDKEQSTNKKKPAESSVVDVAVSVEVEAETTDTPIATSAVKIGNDVGKQVSKQQVNQFTKNTIDKNVQQKPKEAREEKVQHKNDADKEQPTNIKKPVASRLDDVTVTIEVEGDSTDTSVGTCAVKIGTDKYKHESKSHGQKLTKNTTEEIVPGKLKELREEKGLPKTSCSVAGKSSNTNAIKDDKKIVNKPDKEPANNRKRPAEPSRLEDVAVTVEIETDDTAGVSVSKKRKGAVVEPTGQVQMTMEFSEDEEEFCMDAFVVVDEVSDQDD